MGKGVAWERHWGQPPANISDRGGDWLALL